MKRKDLERLRPYLHSFDLQGLFVEGLGWNRHAGEPIRVDVVGDRHSLHPVAEKAGFVVYACDPRADGSIPAYPLRRRIERQVAKRAFEHLIVFLDQHESIQVWQWIRRERGKNDTCTEREYHRGQPGEALLQPLAELAFDIDEETRLTITEVASRVRRAMDVERITKNFYKRFRDELDAFTASVSGIPGIDERRWYASLTLNRLMFVYFIQKRGFLDGDSDYLRNRLGAERTVDKTLGTKDFFRGFLLRLFHEGLGRPETERARDVSAMLGTVPFLNGGIFDRHILERSDFDIRIPDAAFKRIFDFFDSWRWHLDERPRAADDEINPDVLGYIFEQYINQKQMGAYYTKEDVTGYMARNTVVPFLLDAASKGCAVAFQKGGGVWRLLEDDPDRYIYASLGHGISCTWSPDAAPEPLAQPIALPAEIAAGVDNPVDRDLWNTEAQHAAALPAETWREVVVRRDRYRKLRHKLESGAIQTVNDLVTLNLDIERFARDAIVHSEGPELLRAFWQALQPLSVLDPTCGSGAFLFAALNVLEPLYAACIEGMRGFLHDVDRGDRERHPKTLSDFREVLRRLDEHPNPQYYILKSIVIDNLYGVDIMEEAVEICKLRLFLKLASHLDSPEEIEPLPDIDFNIRFGNALVGFTSLNDVRKAIAFDGDGQYRAQYAENEAILDQIEEDANLASRAFREYQEGQTAHGQMVTAAAKSNLRRRLQDLRGRLDHYLAGDYRIDSTDRGAFEKWMSAYSPCHWFVEFYGIVVGRGGFDVVIGNPPYVRKSKLPFTAKGLATAHCPDVYAQVVERSVGLCRGGGRIGMIVPLNLTFSEHYDALRGTLYESCRANWFSSYGRIPSGLFSADVRTRNTIYVGQKFVGEQAIPSPEIHEPLVATTRLHRWFAVQRPFLLDILEYATFSPHAFGGLVPKLSSGRLLAAFERLASRSDYRLRTDTTAVAGKEHALGFKQTAYNWLTCCLKLPPVFDVRTNESLEQTEYGTLTFRDEVRRDLAMLLVNGKLVFVWWIAFGDDFHVTKTNILSAPFGSRQLSCEQRDELVPLRDKLEALMAENVNFKKNAGKRVGNYNLAKCREITDVVDRVWLAAVGIEDLWEEIELEHDLVVKTQVD